MDIGDYAAGIIGNVTCLTNAEEVKLYKNDKYVATFRPDPSFSALPHGPVTIDDTVGALLETEEGFTGEKARVIRKCMNIIRLKGLAGLSAADKALFGYAMVRFRLKYEELVRLYGLYLGNWGGQATAWRFDAVTAGEVIASVTKAPSQKLHLDVTASHTELKEGEVHAREKVEAALSYPVFVKPTDGGSSQGVSRVDRREDLFEALLEAASEGTRVMVEEAIVGREVECAVLSTIEGPKASGVGEIRAAAEFYDFDAKYSNPDSETDTHPVFPEGKEEEIRRDAVKIFETVGGYGLARVDFFLENGTNRVVFNEVNTLPGFTSISMYPMLWKEAGLPLPLLLDKLIEAAFSR